MHRETRMFFQPLLNSRMLVRRVVVADQIQGLALGCFAIDLAQELKPLGMAMPLLALGDDLSVEHLERGEQGDGAVAFVVVSHRRRAPLP